MAFSQNFSVAQNILAPSILVLADVSTGADAAITTRRIYLQLANGNYLTPTGTTTDYIVWDEPDATISLDVLDQDYAISITVQWLSVIDAVLYTKTQIYSFTLYSEQFLYYLTQLQAAGNANVQDTNYFNNKMKLRVFVDAANNAVEFASDIYGAQECLDSAAYMIANQNDYF